MYREYYKDTETNEVIEVSNPHDERLNRGSWHRITESEYRAARDAATIARLRGLLESLDAFIEEDMGEWYSVEFAHLPTRYANIAHMRDAIRDELEAE